MNEVQSKASVKEKISYSVGDTDSNLLGGANHASKI
jgi:hypothetical protein